MRDAQRVCRARGGAGRVGARGGRFGIAHEHLFVRSSLYSDPSETNKVRPGGGGNRPGAWRRRNGFVAHATLATGAGMPRHERSFGPPSERNAQ